MLQITKEDIVSFLKANSTVLENVSINGQASQKLILIGSEDYENFAQKLLDKVINPPS